MKISMNSKTVISITSSAILPVKGVAPSFSKRGGRNKGKILLSLYTGQIQQKHLTERHAQHYECNRFLKLFVL